MTEPGTLQIAPQKLVSDVARTPRSKITTPSTQPHHRNRKQQAKRMGLRAHRCRPLIRTPICLQNTSSNHQKMVKSETETAAALNVQVPIAHAEQDPVGPVVPGGLQTKHLSISRKKAETQETCCAGN